MTGGQITLFYGLKSTAQTTAQTTAQETAFRKKHQLNDKPIVALLPGSRKQEINKMLTGMLSVVKRFSDYQFVIAGAPRAGDDRRAISLLAQDQAMNRDIAKIELIAAEGIEIRNRDNPTGEIDIKNL